MKIFYLICKNQEKDLAIGSDSHGVREAGKFFVGRRIFRFGVFETPEIIRGKCVLFLYKNILILKKFKTFFSHIEPFIL